MSKVGQWRQELQERPAYREGYNARDAGEQRAMNPYRGKGLMIIVDARWDDSMAWECGWDDHAFESINDEPPETPDDNQGT